MPGRFAKAVAAARELGIEPDHSGIQRPSRSAGCRVACPLGFIVTGMGGPYLRHVLTDSGLPGSSPILQMGMSYPADVRAGGRVLQALQDDDRDRGAAELPGEEHPRRGVPRAAARAGGRPDRPAVRQEVPGGAGRRGHRRHPRDPRAEPVGAGPEADPADQGHRGDPRRAAQRPADGGAGPHPQGQQAEAGGVQRARWSRGRRPSAPAARTATARPRCWSCARTSPTRTT